MVHSNYDLNSIKGYPIFKQVSAMLFELVDTESQKEKLESILYEGGYKNYSLGSNICSKDNPYLEMRRRLAIAYLLVMNEKTFDKLVELNVNLFHGTNSQALEGILKNGLKSTEELQKSGVEIKTGEESTRTEYSRDLNFVSFTDILDIASNYSEVPEEDRKKGIFNVIIGTSTDELEKQRTYTISSMLPEVGVNSLPLDNIKMIGVPSDKVEYVKSIINNKDVTVLAVDGIDDRFYYIDDIEASVFTNEFNKLKEKKNNSNNELNEMLKELSSSDDLETTIKK